MKTVHAKLQQQIRDETISLMKESLQCFIPVQLQEYDWENLLDVSRPCTPPAAGSMHADKGSLGCAFGKQSRRPLTSNGIEDDFSPGASQSVISAESLQPIMVRASRICVKYNL